MNRKLKICHVVYAFTDIGGLENGLINIINGICSNQFHHVICSLTKCGGIKSRVSGDNVSYYELNKTPGNDISLPFKICNVLKKENVDIIHLRNWPTMVEGYIAAKISRIDRVIYSEHGRHFEEIETGNLLKFYIKKHIFSNVSNLLTVSEEVEREMRRLYRLHRKVKVVRNGVDSFRFKPMDRAGVRLNNGFSETDTIIGTVSRLVPGKNLRKFIKKFAVCSLDEKFVIVGDGPLKIELENIIKTLRVGQRVVLLGNREDVCNLLNCFDVFVLPSLSEGLSNVVLEAMACALPVVAFNVGGNSELVDQGKGGDLVDIGNTNLLVQKCLNLTYDAERKNNYSIYNIRKILKHFSIHKMVNSYLDMYLKLYNKSV